MDDAPLLALERATVLRGRLTILEEFDFKLHPGERCTVIGPNGSGKSTLLRSLAGLLPLRSGVLFHGNRSIRDQDGRHAFQTEQIGWCPQSAGTTPSATPLEHLQTTLQMHGAKMEEEELIAVLNHWGLDHRRHDRIAWLSGGLRRRLEVASAFIVAETSTSPVPVLLDEPSEGLDEPGVEILLNKIQDTVNSGHSVIVATHDPRLISASEEAEKVDANGMEILRSERNHTELTARICKASNTYPGGMFRWNLRLDLRELSTPAARWLPGLIAFGILIGAGLEQADIPFLGKAALALSPAMISAMIRPSLMDRLSDREMGSIWATSLQGSLPFHVTFASMSVVPAILAIIGLVMFLPTPDSSDAWIQTILIIGLLVDIPCAAGLIHYRFGQGRRPALMILLLTPFAWILLTMCSVLDAIYLEAYAEAWTGIAVSYASVVGLFLLAWALSE
ncbi:MAG TPA: ATP-binding cassette domain-containing protein [Candidatus Thalassarchaeaceae archaeon]|nr:MAG TPA: ATP-binding cassette domain-containing protein [Candidatus Poseidoniales archaeon]HII49281.1 ATP-binding cassette domain-containing protein [Candidatus Thalassarchaeaceae archaeon]